jgi:hypothetical protein
MVLIDGGIQVLQQEEINVIAMNKYLNYSFEIMLSLSV